MSKRAIVSVTVQAVFQKLLYEFGPQNWWPIIRGEECLYLPEFLARDRTEPEIFEIMAGAVLTQNTSWDNVKRALIRLKGENVLSLEGIKKCDIKQLSEWIKPAGYFNQKAKKLKLLVDFIWDELNGNILLLKELPFEESRHKLLSIWGIGPETADSILLYGYHIPVFVVDAYTKRVFQRLGFIGQDADYDEVQKFFKDSLPRDRIVFQEYHALIVALGKRHCKKTRECQNCPLLRNCPSAE